MPVYTYIPLDDPSANGSTDAYGINNAGQIVGSYQVLNRAGFFDSHGFLYSGGAYTTLNDPSVANFNFHYVTIATGINASGQIVGSCDRQVVRGGIRHAVGLPENASHFAPMLNSQDDRHRACLRGDASMMPPFKDRAL